MAIVNTITLPQDVLDRVERVLDYHESTKYTYDGVRHDPLRLDAANKPHEFRVFDEISPLPLPTGLLDLPSATLSLMASGFEALPDSQIAPPQDLKTLATWLHFANGIASRRRTVTQTLFTRTCASDGNAFPGELYVAAFAVEGLAPGLYHYSPREFALRKLREGPETLARLTRGRPDLAFLKTVPLVMLVSTIFCRSTWRFAKRGYRNALHDAGYLVQNLVTVATSLGVQTMTRMILNDSAARELIGVPADVDYGQAEAVQSMVVWADRAVLPMAASTSTATPVVSQASASPIGGSAAMSNGGAAGAEGLSMGRGAMPSIPRPPLANVIADYVSILSTHQDCVAPGVAVREVRPPLTDLSPLPAGVPVFEHSAADDPPAGDQLRKILLTRQATTQFSSRAIPRDEFLLMNRLAFRGGTFYPLHPDGAHAALIRPFWMIHDVTGMDSGVWYYHPPTDAWSLLRHGIFRREAAYLALEQLPFGQASATCFFLANIQYLMSVAGPDIYRLAHLEAGILTNRLALSSEALDLGWCQSASFYDDEARQFLGLRTTGWELLNIVAIGKRLREGEIRPDEAKEKPAATADWRD